MSVREYHQYLELNNGTEIRHSELKYSGVYFECRKPDKILPNGYKRAVACWPACVTPLRFDEVEGYSVEELDELRKQIYKVGDMVVNRLLEEREERERSMGLFMRANSLLFILDEQQAGGFIAAYCKTETATFRYEAALNIGLCCGAKVELYRDNNVLEASIYHGNRNTFFLELNENPNRCYVQNDGDEDIVVALLDNAGKKVILLPGERKQV